MLNVDALVTADPIRSLTESVQGQYNIKGGMYKCHQKDVCANGVHYASPR